MFRNDHSGVVVGFQHQRIEKIFQLIIFTGFDIELNFGHTGCIRGSFGVILQTAVFQGKDTGHDFSCACHGHDPVAVFFIQNAPGICIHQYG